MIESLEFATSTTLSNDGVTLAFQLNVIIFILFLMVVAMVYNNYKSKKPWM